MLKTPKFKAWFRNSKVVDRKGNPLVVYHGTGVDFPSFDSRHTGSGNDEGFAGRGFYFMDDPEWASGYAEISQERGGNPLVLPVYLSLQNPLVVTSYEQLPGVAALGQVPQRKQALEIQKAVEHAGHDGIIVRGKPGNPTEYVAFKANQIKSAIGNDGSYSTTDTLTSSRKPTMKLEAKTRLQATIKATKQYHDHEEWQAAVKEAYPEHAKKMKFKGRIEQGKDTISAEVSGLDKCFGVWDTDKEFGVVL